MRLTTLVCTVALAATILPAAASTIDRVVVYPGQAEVHRLVPLPGKQGAQTVEVAGLPVSVRTETVSLRAPDGVVVGSIRGERVTSSELRNPREAELTAKLQTLQDQRTRAEHAKRAAQLKLDFIQRLATKPGKEESPLPVAQWESAWAAAQRGAEAALNDTLAQDIALRDLDDKIAATKRELAGLQSDRRDTVTLTIDLTASTATREPLRLQYTVGGASWQPSYRAALDTTAGKLVLERQASVRQNTGEDWTNVALVLATGRPRSNTAMPQLQPEVVRLFEPQLQREMLESRAKAMQAPAAMMDAAAEQAAYGGNQIQVDAFAARYAVAGRVSAAGDNTARSFGFGRVTLDAPIELRTTPQLDTSAYLYATLTNTTDTPFPAGRVELLRDSTRAGSGRLPTLPPGADHELGFGVDERVTVEFTALPATEDETLFRGREVETRSFVATVRNGHNSGYPMVIYSRIPVAGDDNIKVKALGAAAKPDRRDIDDRQGVIGWEWQAPAGGEKRLEWGYELSWPGGKNITR